MGLDKNRCQDKLQLQKYTKDVVCSIDAETEKKMGRRRSYRCPTDRKARERREEKGGKQGNRRLANPPWIAFRLTGK